MNLRKVGEGIKTLINNKGNSDHSPALIKINNKQITDPKAIAN